MNEEREPLTKLSKSIAHSAHHTDTQTDIYITHTTDLLRLTERLS